MFGAVAKTLGDSGGVNGGPAEHAAGGRGAEEVHLGTASVYPVVTAREVQRAARIVCLHIEANGTGHLSLSQNFLSRHETSL